jgi:uncharacterized membrane protein
MPNLAVWHPQLVHFVIALGLVGVALRLLSLVLRPAWLSSAAAALLILSAAVAVPAVKSGDDAHGPAERIPGALSAVQDHEHWGERTRNVLLLVAGLEVLVLIAGARPAGRVLRVVAGLGGIAAGYCVYRTADLGGELVYRFAGGIGTRSGDPADLDRLLVAGLFHAARNDREQGRGADAARLIDELALRRPADTVVRVLAIESKLRDRQDPQGALADLAAFGLPEGHRLTARLGLLRAEAFGALGQPDSARAVLTALAAKFPNNQGVRTALERLP